VTSKGVSLAPHLDEGMEFSDQLFTDTLLADQASILAKARPPCPLPDPIEHAAALFLARAEVASLSPVSALVPERTLNFYNLDDLVLDKVAFLSEVDSATLPAGLHLPVREQHEVAYAHARARPELFPPDQLKAGLAKEMHKMFDGMQVLELVTDAATQVHNDALFVPSMILSKQKYHPNGDKDTISCRFAMIGSRTDPAMWGDTSAATADEATTICCMSAFQADAVANEYVADLGYESFDVCGAFLHVDLVSPVQIVTRIPKGIDHPYAGCLCIVRKSCYGLRQSNKAFADDFDSNIKAAGFVPTRDACVYKRIEDNPNGSHLPKRRCYLFTHVDDGKAMFNYRPFYDQLIGVLEKRYGKLRKGPLVGFTGTTFVKHDNGAFTRTQEGYILRFLSSVGVDDLTIVRVASQPDLFGDTSASPLCDRKLYRTLIGSLIHTLRTRYDIQKEVVFLSSRSAAPTEADMAKVSLVLRYLLGSASYGPTYYTTQGALLYAFVDCSYGVHLDGRSHIGYSLHIGDDNAPFAVCSTKQKDCVAVGSMEGEYVALSAVARRVMEFRFFLEDVEFPQTEPTVIYEDNMSAINLAVAPAVTRKSRHIHIRHHFIRDCVAQGFIRVEHLPTARMLADYYTKPFTAAQNARFRDRLFNTASIPEQ
jgi:hypothetical protein